MAFLPISDRDRLTITKLHASASDLGSVRVWAEHLIKKKWFRKPWSRGATYIHQSAYVTALVSAYGRVFAGGRGGFGFPRRLIDYDTNEWALHERLLDMRNKVYAHSDLDKWTVDPWQYHDFETVVLGQPIHLIEESELTKLIGMTERLQAAIGQRYAEILAPYRAAHATPPTKSCVDQAMEAIEQLEVGEMLAIRFDDED